MIIPFQTIDWNSLETTVHKGESGNAYWKTIRHNGLRVRMVEYSPGYVADHWCEVGHVLLCLKGELTTELPDGSTYILKEGMSYHVSDGVSSHRSSTKEGATLFIIDGDFLSS